MRTLVHVSDIHFERVDERIIRKLLHAMAGANPDIIVISGDLTQRARRREFLSAQAFLKQLERLEIPKVVIPGNHDISPIYSPLMRYTNPYRRYRKYIAAMAQDEYADDEVAIAGVNTVRATRIKDGRVSLREAKKKKDWFEQFPESVTKIVVTHHPLDLPTEHPDRHVAMRAKRGLKTLSEGKVDMYLSGHYHRNSVLPGPGRHPEATHSALLIQSGTVSERVRGEPQSFNIIRIDKPAVDVSVFIWSEDDLDFKHKHTDGFVFKNGLWQERD